MTRWLTVKKNSIIAEIQSGGTTPFGFATRGVRSRLESEITLGLKTH